MSLNWNIEGVKDSESVCWIKGDDDKFTMNPVTHAIIFTTMSVDIGRITDDNWPEFYARSQIISRLYGKPLINSDGEEADLTPEDVKAHIGLYCNVITLPRTKWLTKTKQTLNRMTDEALWQAKRSDEKQTVSTD